MIPSQVIDEAIKTYGVENQLIVAIEELSELQKELTKLLRGQGNHDHIVEELVDVLIMLEQVEKICNISHDEKFVKRIKKINRLLYRLKNGGKNENQNCQ